MKTTTALRTIALATATTALAVAGTVASTGTAEAAIDRQSDYVSIWDDEPLYPGWYIESGATRAIMQTDGNFVVYQFGTQVKMATGTVGCGYKAVMQVDGNFVVYSANGSPCWHTGTQGHPHARLTVTTGGTSGVYWGGGIIPRLAHSANTGPGPGSVYFSSDLY
ncbi:hypothetical protein AB0E96_34230 [Kitasatospora sp. NPDC036755]|uniref:hypothetical protein n=1 Tax=Kitasatospora sp. NPDC036755 TaxID=3154600 RepID=UPI0033CCEFC0